MHTDIGSQTKTKNKLSGKDHRQRINYQAKKNLMGGKTHTGRNILGRKAHITRFSLIKVQV